MELNFGGVIWFWKGPAPWYFITVPEEFSVALAATSAAVSYGWGMIPVSVEIGRTRWTTSLFPKDGSYVVPVKAAVRQVEDLAVGDIVKVQLTVDI